ncbi:hypothetical protein [Prosthecobacter sp.]|uniref:hypothetical protein n=1 Tax=Prosthecobacter sp. TaxID=1965333 RepID=UPI0037846F2E
MNITLMVRNADGWLIDMAERHPKEMLKDPDFQLPTFLAWKKNKVNIPGQPANTKEDEEKFEKWVSDKVKANPGLLTADKMGDDSLLKQVLAIDANPPAKVEAAVVTKWNGALLEYVDKTPGSLEGSGFTSLDALKNFLSQRGKMAVLVTADEKARARAWLAGVYDMLRLNVAGRHLASIAPTPGMKHALSDVEMPQQTKDDTWERIAFANVKPDKNDLEVWQHLVQTHGLECAAPLSLSIQLGDTKSVVETMPTLVNQGVSGEKEDFGLPMRSRLMRALAWSAMFGVLWFIVLVCVQTSVLRESLQVGNTLVTRYEESPWSASRLVFAWWLAICTSCFLFLWAMKGEMKVLSATAATLLGISGTTLAASSFLGASRGMKPQKATQGFLADIISESGEPEISRLQMLVWNGVLGVVFVWQTLENWVMPDFDPNLNALVGISSTAYVGYKWSNQKQDGQANANPNPNANVNGNVRG